MRVAPVGAWFAHDLDRVAEEARASAMVTHMHSEGVAGAIAIAIAAAMGWRLRENRSADAAVEFFNEVLRCTPDSETRRGIGHAFQVRQFQSPEAAARTLGNGSSVTCPDTVPFAIWSAAKHLYNYREAIAATASVGGDVDTNCAIVGDFLRFLARRKRYWPLPMALTLILLGLLVVLTEGSAVAPFIYTLF